MEVPRTFRDDPLFVLDTTLPPEDFEILSFIVAGLSYGRVEQIKASSFNFLTRLGNIGLNTNGLGLRNFLKKDPNAVGKIKDAMRGFSHRLNTAEDMVDLLQILSALLQKNKSLCELYQKSLDSNPKLTLERFTRAFANEAMAPNKMRRGRKWRGTGPEWFFCSPAGGGTCKRLMMWLRWMVRKDAIDPGIWQDPRIQNKKLPLPHPSQLFLPVDTHIFNWARNEKIVRTKSPTWKSVEEITSHFRKILVDDPCKFDFELSHRGMEKFRESRP